MGMAYLNTSLTSVRTRIRWYHKLILPFFRVHKFLDVSTSCSITTHVKFFAGNVFVIKQEVLMDAPKAYGRKFDKLIIDKLIIDEFEEPDGQQMDYFRQYWINEAMRNGHSTQITEWNGQISGVSY